MKYILLEDLNLLLIQQDDGEWEIQPTENIEMNCIKVGKTYYERIRSLDMDISEVQPIQQNRAGFDDFDLRISCEEYYGG